MPTSRFTTHNIDGTPKACKWCGAHVWWERALSRWYNPDGKTLHVETCEARRQYYHDLAMEAAEVRRQQKVNDGR